jgi:hypothetical protein
LSGFGRIGIMGFGGIGIVSGEAIVSLSDDKKTRYK